jgi:Flp pilus assembly protein TadG
MRYVDQFPELSVGQDDSGAATASVVVIFPVLLFVFMALVQWGLYFHAQSVVDAAAQDASRAARDVGATSEAGHAVADELLAGATGSGLIEDVAINVAEADGTVRATVRGDVRALVPLPGFDLTVEGVSAGPKERFIAEDQR